MKLGVVNLYKKYLKIWARINWDTRFYYIILYDGCGSSGVGN